MYSQVAVKKDVNGATFSTSSVVALDLQRILVIVTVGSATGSGESASSRVASAGCRDSGFNLVNAIIALVSVLDDR